jgi:hypothetical protein
MNQDQKQKQRSGSSKYHHIISEILKVSDFAELVNNLKLKDKYEKKDIDDIFSEFDHENTGEVNFNDFIKTILDKTQNSKETKFSAFYLSAINFFLTPSERISETIKRAIKELNFYNPESKIIKELQWVIRTLSEKDLFDFRLKDEFVSPGNYKDNEILKFLSEYSHDGIKRQKIDDLELLNEISLKKKKIQDCK